MNRIAPGYPIGDASESMLAGAAFTAQRMRRAGALCTLLRRMFLRQSIALRSKGETFVLFAKRGCDNACVRRAD